MEATIVMPGTVEERIKAGRVICRASLTPVRGFRRARSIDESLAIELQIAVFADELSRSRGINPRTRKP